MIDLSEMAEYVDNAAAQGVPALVATAGADGQPNLAFKGSLMVWDREHMAFWERAHGETLAHLKENPQIAAGGSDVLYPVGPPRRGRRDASAGLTRPRWMGTLSCNTLL